MLEVHETVRYVFLKCSMEGDAKKLITTTVKYVLIPKY